ncbi:MAG: Replication-relaxation [Myxococcales bacterium]|nr:Replication-relaxation [Myxococcales bacterium]
MKLPWPTTGARLHAPRDPHLAYAVGRMAIATSADTWPLFFGSHSAGKTAYARLQRLGLLRSFPRSPSEHAWYALTSEAAPWVAEVLNCDASELRTVQGISRLNLNAVRARNRLWVSTVVACRTRGDARLVLVRPEWELRRARAGQPLVPDLQIVVESTDDERVLETAWFVELDAGTERLAVWHAKAEQYRAAKTGALYDEPHWQVLASVPSLRRARSVATAVAAAGAGRVFWLGVQGALEDGHALDACLWRADDLAAQPASAATWSLIGRVMPGQDPGPQPRSAAAQGSRGSSSGDSQ